MCKNKQTHPDVQLVILKIDLQVIIQVQAKVNEVDGRHKQAQPRMKSREQFEGNIKRIGLKKKDAADRCRWREGVRRVAKVVGCIRLLPFTRNKPE